MAIDSMKKVTILCQVTAAQRLIKTVHGLSLVELTDAMAQYGGVTPPAHGDAGDAFRRDEVSSEECDRHLAKANLILGLLDVFFPEKQGFIAGLAPVPLAIEPEELDHAIHQFDLDSQYAVAVELDEVYRRTERTISEVEAQLKDLIPFADLPFNVGDMAKPQRTRILFGSMPAKGLDVLEQDSEASQLLAWEKMAPVQTAGKSSKGDAVRVLVAYQRENESAVRAALASAGFEEILLPAASARVADRISELQGDLDEAQGHVRDIESKVKAFEDCRRPLKVLRAFWESKKTLYQARANAVNGKWVHILTGYIREKDVEQLDEMLKRDFPTASMQVEDPAADDDVPVSISLPPLVRPIQMLINLYGLPNYRSFDPSPFMVVNFYLFFGICFSDMAYGIMLVALSWYIMSKTRQYESLYNFAKLLLFCGFSTIIFGGLLGSFFGDLYTAQYMGENNLLLRFMSTVRVIDPLEKPVVVLVMALFIGMMNQFYGIALKIYGALRRGDKAEAICDGLTWLVILPGFVVLISSAFVPVPKALLNVGLVVFFIGAAALVLTQGRASKGIVGKVMTGLISLYGVVGTYGLTAFIGDTMSYCRLLALGLTTSIIGISFNMIAGLLRPVPVAGIVLFILVVIVGHLFNFAISVLGAFVHSMRLIFVEWFGRFYSGGAKPFAPLGFNSRSAILVKKN